MNPQLWWQVARAGGLVAYGLLAASTIWGLAVSTRLLGRWPAPGWTLDLHRYLGGLAVAFTGIHLAALLLDSYIQFDLLDLLVPLASTWRPGAVAWGVVALYLLVAVQATSLARRRLPHRLWRRVHLAAFPLAGGRHRASADRRRRPRQPRRPHHAHAPPSPPPPSCSCSGCSTDQDPTDLDSPSDGQCPGIQLAAVAARTHGTSDGHLRGRHDG